MSRSSRIGTTARGSEAQQSAGAAKVRASSLCATARESGLCAREESFAGFAQTTLRVVRMKSAARRASRVRVRLADRRLVLPRVPRLLCESCGAGRRSGSLYRRSSAPCLT